MRHEVGLLGERSFWKMFPFSKGGDTRRSETSLPGPFTVSGCELSNSQAIWRVKPARGKKQSQANPRNAAARFLNFFFGK